MRGITPVGDLSDLCEDCPMTAERLTGLDASFLHMERAGAHMHVASTIVFEGPPPPPAGFRDHIGSRLHLVPRFRQKLRFVPFDQGRPVWVDDPHLNLDYHVRQTALPSPGSDEQLRTLAARIFSQQLDRSKPLWELWLVEGMADGRFAVIGKSHHALVDGVSGVDITTVLYDLDREPKGPPSTPPPWLARPEPTDTQLLGDALKERLTSPKEIVRGFRAALRRPRPGGRGADKEGAPRPARPRHPLQRRDRPAPPLPDDPGRAGRPEAREGRPRGNGQRRDPLDRLRGARPLPTRPGPRHRGDGAAGDGPGLDPRGGAARGARPPALGDG